MSLRLFSAEIKLKKDNLLSVIGEGTKRQSTTFNDGHLKEMMNGVLDAMKAALKRYAVGRPSPGIKQVIQFLFTFK